MTQIITNSNGGGGSSSSGDMKKAVYDPQNIENDAFDYENFTNTPDLSVYQTKDNLVTDLTNPDNTHYPSAKAVSDAISGAGAGDMLKSVYDPDNVEANAFDYNNFINTPTIPTDTSELTNGAGFITGIDSSDVTTALGYTPYNATNPNGYVTSSIINDTAYGSGWDGDTTHAPTKNAVYDKIDSIDELIPSAATSSNQLADKNYVNDSINSVTAYYITKNAAGDQFATKAELTAATTFYSGGVVRVPTRNDYTIVLADEDHDNATTRYIYNSGWEYQYTVNETALTQAQLDAINSGITAAKVSTYDGYASGKQDKLTTQTAYTNKGTSSKVPQITTNSLGQVTAITEVDINYPSQVDDTAYGNSWDGVTYKAPSQNAVYDKISSMDTAISNKQDTLVSGTNIKTINGESVLGSGDIEISGGTDYSWVTKTIGDTDILDYSDMQGPAPDGFHVPLTTDWQGLKTIMDGLGLTTGDNWRINLHMPFAGNRDYSNAGLNEQNSIGRYCSSSPVGSFSQDLAFSLRLNSSNVYAAQPDDRAKGCSVRCFKNSFELPTSSWTVINGTLGSAGIFRDTVNGLISITGDGTTGYTIQDKNLGATTVYSNGATLSEANCGKYYQWGNNYGFAWTGSVTTSSTQVNASTYGPGNYYSSSTFITGSYDWSSVHNDNLRGGENGAPYFKGVDISLRTIVNIPSSDFLLTAPATLSEGEEYVIRIISEDNYTMTLGTGFTNPWNVDTSLSFYATDQFVFLAVGGVLELQPLVATGE